MRVLNRRQSHVVGSTDSTRWASSPVPPHSPWTSVSANRVQPRSDRNLQTSGRNDLQPASTPTETTPAEPKQSAAEERQPAKRSDQPAPFPLLTFHVINRDGAPGSSASNANLSPQPGVIAARSSEIVVRSLCWSCCSRRRPGRPRRARARALQMLAHSIGLQFRRKAGPVQWGVNLRWLTRMRGRCGERQLVQLITAGREGNAVVVVSRGTNYTSPFH